MLVTYQDDMFVIFITITIIRCAEVHLVSGDRSPTAVCRRRGVLTCANSNASLEDLHKPVDAQLMCVTIRREEVCSDSDPSRHLISRRPAHRRLLRRLRPSLFSALCFFRARAAQRATRVLFQKTQSSTASGRLRYSTPLAAAFFDSCVCSLFVCSSSRTPARETRTNQMDILAGGDMIPDAFLERDPSEKPPFMIIKLGTLAADNCVCAHTLCRCPLDLGCPKALLFFQDTRMIF